MRVPAIRIRVAGRGSGVAPPNPETPNLKPDNRLSSSSGTVAAYAMCLGLLALSGCAHEYRAFNPYPNLRTVAVAPFINLSNSPAVDGRHLGAAYYAELQKVPGFEVVPIGVVETAMREHGLTLSGAEEAQQLARILGVDCVVVGAVTDFTPYYPPRLALQIEWYAADPAAVFEAAPSDQVRAASQAAISPQQRSQVPRAPAEGEMGLQPPLPEVESLPDDAQGPVETPPESPKMLPSEPSMPQLPLPGDPPILTYTRLFDGADERFTRALADYIGVRDDVRFGGVQGYLQRTDDFIRFACHEAIYEMLGRTPGAVETRLVFRRPNRR